MTYCNLDTEEIRRFQEVYTRAELKKWFEELVSEYEKWARYQMEWRAKRNAGQIAHLSYTLFIFWKYP